MKSDMGLRRALLDFIADFANWDHSSDKDYLTTARTLVKAAHPEETPLVVDPFAGGGSIPLEALRVGCEAFASDLNPVACLILKVMLEDIPRHGPKLAKELRQVGKEIKEKAEKELAEYYPTDPDGATPIAYLWARTVQCEAPNCGGEIPLMRSFWLCKKPNRRRALQMTSGGFPESGDKPLLHFEIYEPPSESAVGQGTVSRARARCPHCSAILPPERVRSQLTTQQGGADVLFDKKGKRIGGARMLAVVTLRPGEKGRHYRLPNDRDYLAVFKAKKRIQEILTEWENSGRQGLCPIPDEPTPAGGGSGAGRAFSVQKYGMMTFGDLFTARQKVGLFCLGRYVCINPRLSTVANPLALSLSRCTEQMSSLVRWRITVEAVAGTFGRNALPMMWDFVEIVPSGDDGSNFSAAVDWVAEVIEKQGESIHQQGQTSVSDCTKSPLPDDSAWIWFTDPPYYDAIPYSDLSDFFLAWLKRILPDNRFLQDPFDHANPLSPKTREAVQDETKRVDGIPKDRVFFENVMEKAFAEGCRVLRSDGIGSVVFAHKTTEGWEALLSGLISGGWTITGSWPLATERPGRLRSQESAALATSIHLVYRPRPTDASIGDWGSVLKELPHRVEAWMERLQEEGIRGADLVFACIGPALEIFSRYERVEEADGTPVDLAAYLLKVWEVVGRTALKQILDTGTESSTTSVGALEEDARLTALFLWTLQSTKTVTAGNGKADTDSEEEQDEEDEPMKVATKGGFSLIYDMARRFAQPLGIHLEDWEGRIIETSKGDVRLLPVTARARQLFGEEGARAVAARLESAPAGPVQLSLATPPVAQAKPQRGRRKGSVGAKVDPDDLRGKVDATTLDRVHMAMLLQKGGQSHGLKALLEAEMARGSEFLRLANALSALYPTGCEEKRLLDAMLLAVPR